MKQNTKHMEHSEIIVTSRAAFNRLIAKAGSEGVSQSQVSNLVLAEHPGLDPLRLKRCVDIMWKQLDLDHFDEAEQKALFEQQIRHAKTLSPRQGTAYLTKCSDEAGDRAFRAFVHAWLLSLESRIFGYMPGWDPDKTTLTDVVHAIGVDGYVEAMRAELAKDAVIDGDVVVFEVPDMDRTVRFSLNATLDQARRYAKEILKKSAEVRS